MHRVMALHFFYESLGTYAKDKEFWLRMLYLGMLGDQSMLKYMREAIK